MSIEHPSAMEIYGYKGIIGDIWADGFNYTWQYCMTPFLGWPGLWYSAYHQIVTIKISKKP